MVLGRKTGKRKCNKCGKSVPLSQGVSLLRGITFYCKSCYNKQKKKTKPTGETCEFC